jgi:hypothetical protein
MGPYAGVDFFLTSPYVHSRVDSNTCTMGNPMPESALTLCQRRLYAPVKDLGFGLYTISLYTVILKKTKCCRRLCLMLSQIIKDEHGNHPTHRAACLLYSKEVNAQLILTNQSGYHPQFGSQFGIPIEIFY